jgi:hypothetical protein
VTDHVDRPPTPTPATAEFPPRGLAPEERDVVARLAQRYPDLRLIEMELGELERLRGEHGGAPAGSHYSASDLMDLHDAGLISSEQVRQLLGLERRPRASAWEAPNPPSALPSLPSLPDLPRLSVPENLRSLAGEWWIRLTWALVWRWCALGAGMVLLPSAAEVRAASGKRLIELLAIVAVVLGIGVIGVVTRWWRKGSFFGSLIRTLLAIVVVNLAFLLPTGILMAVMLIAFLGLTADAFAAVFWWSRPRSGANAPG